MINKLAVIIATWFGSGLIPPPRFMHGLAGTYGSIAALPLCWLLVERARYLKLTSPVDPEAWFIYLFWIAIIFMIGMVTIRRAEITLGPRTDWRDKTKTRDQNQIVIDEVVGMLVTCLPLTVINFNNWILALGFALIYFRFFDIVKVWPTQVFDRLDDAFGVIMDDVMAGIYAAIALTVTVIALGI